MEPRIGIKQELLNEVALRLSHLLADEFVLYAKTKNAHWNIEGPDFHSMHLFFKQQYEQLDDMMDTLAERIRMLGHNAPSSLKMSLSLTHLEEIDREDNTSLGFIAELLDDHESIIKRLRVNIESFAGQFNDIGSSDLITGLMGTHEEMAWHLRSHLKS